jgi:hypothetical protein
MTNKKFMRIARLILVCSFGFFIGKVCSMAFEDTLAAFMAAAGLLVNYFTYAWACKQTDA